jgi:hypothetical protein
MQFRVARHTNRIVQLTDFYVQVIGLENLGAFKNHSGYDGVFIGKENSDWHLEFTQTNETVDHKFDDDDILVFYPATATEYRQIVKNIKARNLPMLTPKNPYWQENGVAIKDPDGYCVVISPLRIKEKVQY